MTIDYSKLDGRGKPFTKDSLQKYLLAMDDQLADSRYTLGGFYGDILFGELLEELELASIYDVRTDKLRIRPKALVDELNALGQLNEQSPQHTKDEAKRIWLEMFSEYRTN